MQVVAPRSYGGSEHDKAVLKQHPNYLAIVAVVNSLFKRAYLHSQSGCFEHI